MANLENALKQIREEHKHAELRVEKLDEVIRRLVGLNGSASAGKGARRSRTMSVSARRRISLAQKARWAKRGKATPKRTMSASARRRIAAAQRARWAKWKRTHKKAG